jgi:hypothetical protein
VTGTDDPQADDRRESVLDGADRRWIRDWFRKLVTARRQETGVKKPDRGESAPDLYLPPGLAADVKGGASEPSDPNRD